jgi:hypothetical protein
MEDNDDIVSRWEQAGFLNGFNFLDSEQLALKLEEISKIIVEAQGEPSEEDILMNTIIIPTLIFCYKANPNISAKHLYNKYSKWHKKHYVNFKSALQDISDKIDAEAELLNIFVEQCVNNFGKGE